MARPIKIAQPRPNQGKKKGRYNKHKVNKEWAYGYRRPSGQQPQSPIRELKDMTAAEMAAILERLEAR